MQYLNSLSIRVFINSTITRFIAAKATDQPVSPPLDTCKSDPVRVGFAEILRGQLKDLSQEICAISSLYLSATGSEQDLKLREAKPPIVNQQCLLYKFECDLCDEGYVGFTCRHSHQRVDKHKYPSSSISKHFQDSQGLVPIDLSNNFSVPKMCKNKFDCLVFEMNVFYRRTQTHS